MKTLLKFLLTIIVFAVVILVLSHAVFKIWSLINADKSNSLSYYQVALSLLGIDGLTSPPAWPDLAIGFASVILIAVFSAVITFYLVWQKALALGKELTLKQINGQMSASVTLSVRRAVYDVRVFLSYYDKAKNVQLSDEEKTIPMLRRGKCHVIEFPVDYTTHLLFFLRDKLRFEKEISIYATAIYTNASTNQQSIVTKELRIPCFDAKQVQGFLSSRERIWQAIDTGCFPIDTSKLQVVHGEAVEMKPIVITQMGKPARGTQIKIDFTKMMKAGDEDAFVSAYLSFNNAPQNWLQLYNDNASLVFDITGDGNIQECVLEVKFGIRLEKLIDYPIKFDGGKETKHCTVNLQQAYNRQFGLEAFKDIREVCFVVFENVHNGKKVMSYSIMNLCMQLS